MTPELASLGFSSYFAQQLENDQVDGRCARVVELQRDGIIASDGSTEFTVSLGGAWFRKPAEERPTVGDWVLLDESQSRIERLLERKSVFKRIAAGRRIGVQLIAANVDTLFIVTSCNEDFNESRLERYLALAINAGVYPVIVITKTDLCDDADSFRERATRVRPDVPVELVNAKDPDTLDGATAWVSPGATVALVGSSGVGKSTLVNTLAGEALAATADVRASDDRGRHTTSYRALYRLEGGGLLLDVPGMRELRVADVSEALGELFDDVRELASTCRFSDCAHESEPGCAVKAAIEDGRLDARRLENYRKLQREEARHSRTLHEQREKDRGFGRIVREAMDRKRAGKDVD